jgi:hypothetical protein
VYSLSIDLSEADSIDKISENNNNIATDDGIFHTAAGILRRRVKEHLFLVSN